MNRSAGYQRAGARPNQPEQRVAIDVFDERSPLPEPAQGLGGRVLINPKVPGNGIDEDATVVHLRGLGSNQPGSRGSSVAREARPRV